MPPSKTPRQAYDEGWAAHRDGARCDTDPYAEGTPEHTYWDAGWDEANNDKWAPP